MTKEQIKKALQSDIDQAWAVSKQRIADMQEQAGNPQVALMIEKNNGYMLALEDIIDMLYSRRLF
jgi:hypothetical protein